MELLKRFEPLGLMIVVLGALNWGMVGLFHTNVVSEIFTSGSAQDVVYTVVGIAGLTLLPRLMSALHISDRFAPTH
jgi:uncharacterized membrane protein YuzA (DUF378 family)